MWGWQRRFSGMEEEYGENALDYKDDCVNNLSQIHFSTVGVQG